MLVSVCICTWNRAGLLDQTLLQMHNLKIPFGVEWELLIVNNNCTDDTDVVITRHSEDLPIRRLFEPKPGLSNARNCAIAATRGELLIWTDDDVLVASDWVCEHVAAARAWPSASFFGGTIDPWFAVEPPRWIQRHMRILGACWAVRQLGEVVRPLEPGEFPFGANLAFRTDVLRKYGFDPRLGRNGDELMGGEEVDVMERMAAAGELGVWVGTAGVRHYIPANRITLSYIYNYIIYQGRHEVRREGVPRGKRLMGAPRWAIRKYWEAWLKAFCLTPTRGDYWLGALWKRPGAGASLTSVAQRMLNRVTALLLPRRPAVKGVEE